MLSPAVTIRRARPEDASDLADLAALDSAKIMVGDILLAESGGAPVAALHLLSGRAIADPLTRSAEAVDLLRVRARQIRAADGASHAGGRRRGAPASVAGLLR